MDRSRKDTKTFRKLFSRYRPSYRSCESISVLKSRSEQFRQNFIDGWESEGASLAVFVKGKKVVDVWGGYADKQAARKWEQVRY